MFKEVFTTLFLTITITTNFLMADVQYDIQDIDTMQTKSSQAIDLNNQGQILGWYNIDGSNEGKHFFVRNKDGSFFEVPKNDYENNLEINWRYLTNNGYVYGTYDGNTNFAVLYMWHQYDGVVVKLGDLPGKEISAINDAGQVLIKSVDENVNGKLVRHPIIWKNGEITRLKGLWGNLGIESEESYGLDMNNNGEVVGQSLVYINYKNEFYKQIHAVKWVEGQATDLHYKLPKSENTMALAINDHGYILYNINNSPYIQKADGSLILANKGGWPKKVNNNGEFYNDYFVFFETNTIKTYVDVLTRQVEDDVNSLWTNVIKIIKVNDNGEIIAHGRTIYGEKHSMLLIPVSSD